MGGRLVSCWPRWLALAAALTVLTAAPALAQLTDPVGPGQSVNAPAPMCPAISSNCYMQALFTNQAVPGTPARCGPFPGCTYGERYFFADGYRFQMLSICGANCTTQYWVTSRSDNRPLLVIEPTRGGAILATGPSTTQNDPHPPLRVIQPDYGPNDLGSSPSMYKDTPYSWDAARAVLVPGPTNNIPAADFRGWDAVRQELTGAQYVEIFPGL